MTVENAPVRVLHTVRGLGINGITHVVLRTVLHLDPKRFDSDLCSIYPEDARGDAFRDAGAEVHHLKHQNILSAPRSVARLVQIIREREIDLVHVNQTIDLLLAGLAARICGVPVVATVHWMAGSQLEQASAIKSLGRWIKILARAVGERYLTDGLITVSAAVRDSHVRLLGGLFPVRRARVVYPGLPLGSLPVNPPDDWEELRVRAGLNGAYPVILNVGRLELAKGQEYLVPVMERVIGKWPEARLLIAGDGPRRDELTTLIRRADLDHAIHLLGWRLDVDRLMQVSHVVLLSSVTEAFPLPVVEAMRAARPVVASGVGGVPEMMESGVHGRVVPAGDPAALANAVLDVVQNAEEAAAMGVRGRERVKARFDVRTTVRKLEQVYARMVGM